MILLQPRRPWSEVFRRSRISPHVFVVAVTAAEEVDRMISGLGLPEASSNSLFDNAHWVTPLLDGAVARLRAYGLPRLPSATRVYGHRPPRLLCHLMDLQPPARALTGERSVPKVDQLLADLDRQRRADTKVLLAQARTAMANDSQEVLAAVRTLFGEEAAGRPSSDRPRRPGPGAVWRKVRTGSWRAERPGPRRMVATTGPEPGPRPASVVSTRR